MHAADYEYHCTSSYEYEYYYEYKYDYAASYDDRERVRF